MFSGSSVQIRTLIMILLLAGCGTLVGNPEDDANQHEPTEAVGGPEAQIVTFKIADAPIDDAVSVFVTVESVEIKPENGDWTTVPLLIEQEIDLLQYQDGASVAFAKTGAVGVGVYSGTRLVFSSTLMPRIVFADGTSKNMQIGSAGMNIEMSTPFTVIQGMPVEITFDFDLRKSLQTKGEGGSKEYTLNPTLRMLKAGEFGEITGTAPEGNVVCVYLIAAEMDNDDHCKNAINSAKVKNGKYTLPYMPEGSYKVRVFDKIGVIKQAEAEANELKVIAAVYKANSDKKEDKEKADKETDEDSDDDAEKVKDKGKSEKELSDVDPKPAKKNGKSSGRD